MATFVRNGVLFDGSERDPISRGAVLVDGGHIVAAGSENTVQAPRDARVVDADGGTIIPGLFNLHDHLCRKSVRVPGPGLSTNERVFLMRRKSHDYLVLYMAHHALAELRSGVTTIRDFGAEGYAAIGLMHSIEDGLTPGPHIIAAGRPVCVTGGHGTSWGAREADGPEEVRKAVREQIKAGATCIKLMASGGLGGFPEEDTGIPELTMEEMRAGVDEAHKWGRRTSAHAYPKEAIRNAVLAGIDSIEHGAFLDEELVSLMRERNVALVPTVSGLIPVAFNLKMKGRQDHYDVIMKNVISPQQASIRLAIESGICVGTGSDTNGEIVEEMELLQEAAGLSNLECIRMATSSAAKIAGIDKSVGVLEPGKLANLVIVNGNPLDRLADLRRPRWVIYKGEVFEGVPMPLGMRLAAEQQ
ncbi:MAG: amidohydrolase family protein [Chloroflexi bacterium]|nr:amidohydrolase family protein [Chloroflexota bacterium]